MNRSIKRVIAGIAVVAMVATCGAVMPVTGSDVANAETTSSKVTVYMGGGTSEELNTRAITGTDPKMSVSFQKKGYTFAAKDILSGAEVVAPTSVDVSDVVLSSGMQLRPIITCDNTVEEDDEAVITVTYKDGAAIVDTVMYNITVADGSEVGFEAPFDDLDLNSESDTVILTEPTALRVASYIGPNGKPVSDTTKTTVMVKSANTKIAKVDDGSSDTKTVEYYIASASGITIAPGTDAGTTVLTVSILEDGKVNENLVENIYVSTSKKEKNIKAVYATPAMGDRSADIKDGTYELSTILKSRLYASLSVEMNEEGPVQYLSDDPTIVEVSDKGMMTAKSKGTAKITIVAPATSNYKGDTTTIKVTVSNVVSSDTIFVKDDDGREITTVDLDPSASTASTAVKSMQLHVISDLGAESITYQMVMTNNDAASAPVGDDVNIASVSPTGLVSAGSKTGTLYIRITTQTNKVSGEGKTTKYVTVVVHEKPMDVLSVAPVGNPIQMDLKDNKVFTLTAIGAAASIDSDRYSLIAEASDAGEIADAVTAVEPVDGTWTIAAGKVGMTTLTVIEKATDTTRVTTKSFKIKVLEAPPVKPASDLAVASTRLTVEVGKTVNAGATSTQTLTYSSDKPEVAAVGTDGEIAGLAAGVAVITIRAAETETMSAGEKTVTVEVTSPDTPADPGAPTTKKKNPMTVTGKIATIKLVKLNTSKKIVLARKKVLTIKKAKGTLTFTKKSGKAKITIAKKTGKVTVKKGLKKGTYKVKVKVKAAGNDTYKAKTVTATFSICIK